MLDSRTYKVEFNNRTKVIKELDEKFVEFQSKLKNKFKIDEEISIMYNDIDNDIVTISDDEDLYVFKA